MKHVYFIFIIPEQTAEMFPFGISLRWKNAS